MSKIDIIDAFGKCDVASSFTHLVGALVFAVLSVSLMRRGTGSRTNKIALGVFAVCAVSLLTLSGLYHLCPRGGALRAVMLRVDMGAIFVLIAGTYTPAHIILMRGFKRWGVLAIIWGLAIVGIVINTLFLEVGGKWLALGMFLTLGWIGIYSTIEIGQRFGWDLVETLVIGGVAYSLGGLLDLIGTPIIFPGIFGPHEMLHLLVLVGLGCHWHFTYRIAAGRQPITRSAVARRPVAVPNMK